MSMMGSPQEMGSNMGPQAGSRPPKHLMTMLATLMLNQRLQQRGGSAPINPGMQPPGMRAPVAPAQNRMAELARMQLNSGGGQRPQY